MGKTLDSIKTHLKSKRTRALEDRITEIEDKAISAYNKLQAYMAMDKKTLPAYVDVMQAMDAFRRNPLLSNEFSDDVGYYYTLKDEARHDKKVAHLIEGLKSRLGGMGIDIDTMQTEPILDTDFATWSDEITSYITNAKTGDVTLNNYVSMLGMIGALQSAGNQATNSVIVPMKLALEKRGVSIFEVINYKDPMGEAHLLNTKEYESEVNKGMHRAISYMCGISNPDQYTKLYDPYGNRAYITGRPMHKQEDEYMRIYDSVHYAVKPTIDQIYNTPLCSLDVTKYPPVEDLVNYGISWARENEVPTNN